MTDEIKDGQSTPENTAISQPKNKGIQRLRALAPRHFLSHFRKAPEANEANQTQFDYRTAVTDYLLKHREQVPPSRDISIDIPTLHGMVRYSNKDVARAYVTDRTAPSYDAEIFSDEYSKVYDAVHKIPIGIKRENPTLIAGGKEGALGGKRTILDIGSGEAVGLLDLSIQYPDATFLGIDSNYDRKVTFDTTRPGVQLSKDNWETLETVPDNSADTIISALGATEWGIRDVDRDVATEKASRIITSVTRVAKTGAIFRYGHSGVYDDVIETLLTQHGWEIHDIPGNNKVAIKKV
ncbi:MAG TPA: hypothetical protein VLF93_02865 [Candidatus Saccharimonadales bacterium]|nr:hypothetical protein [Candidatus Saccharimonadales bacterium]